MNDRDILYREAISKIEFTNPQKESILYHNIYSLQMSGNYLFSSKEEILDLVKFLNSIDN